MHFVGGMLIGLSLREIGTIVAIASRGIARSTGSDEILFME